MSVLRFIQVPEKLTDEDVKRFRTIEKIEIVVSSVLEKDPSAPKDKDGRIALRPKVKKVVVEKESQMVPELVMAGPARRGDVNLYCAIDGQKYYFSVKTGEALGGRLKPIEMDPQKGKFVNLGMPEPSRGAAQV